MSTATVQFSSRTAAAPGLRRTAIRETQPVAAGRAPRVASSGSVRLTTRGRFVILATLLAVAFGACTVLGGPAVSTGTTHHVAAQQVVVAPGQTLWDIATSIAPGEDPRDVIKEIVDLNALTSSGSIRAGQPLYVPSY